MIIKVNIPKKPFFSKRHYRHFPLAIHPCHCGQVIALQFVLPKLKPRSDNLSKRGFASYELVLHSPCIHLPVK